MDLRADSLEKIADNSTGNEHSDMDGGKKWLEIVLKTACCEQKREPDSSNALIAIRLFNYISIPGNS